MNFVKYHGTGNDFIIIDKEPTNPKQLAKSICNRHFGVGADGLIYPSDSKVADIKMNYYNSDGSIAKMCGNGLRCFVKFLKDEKIISVNNFFIETLAGVKEVSIEEDLIKVEIGKPNLSLGIEDIRTPISGFDSFNFNNVKGYVLGVGTIHTVIYINENENLKLMDIAPLVQTNKLFVNQTNVNFVKVIDDKSLKVETYERGAGWTLSCGTGVAASAYHAYITERVKSNKIEVLVPGGLLSVSIYDNTIYLIGPAVKIAKGVFYEKN